LAVDKVKPLKFETPTDGTELDVTPTGADPAEDYLACKGMAFENLDTFLAKKEGGVLRLMIPDASEKPTFHTTGANDGELDYVEYFEGTTQTTINRRGRVDFTYDGSLNPLTEVWKIYDPSDGTTVLETGTITHTWSGVDLTKSVEVTT